ncbi:MAG: hypothetical protein ABSE74_02205 [Methanoregula sp.]
MLDVGHARLNNNLKEIYTHRSASASRVIEYSDIGAYEKSVAYLSSPEKQRERSPE